MLADDLSGRKRLKAFNRMLCSLLFIPLSDGPDYLRELNATREVVLAFRGAGA
jgi:hypothetical protein